MCQSGESGDFGARFANLRSMRTLPRHVKGILPLVVRSVPMNSDNRDATSCPRDMVRRIVMAITISDHRSITQLYPRRLGLAGVLMLGCALFGFVRPLGGQEACPTEGCVRPHVILIRGGAGYWPGACDLADHLRDRGFVPHITYHWEYPFVARILAEKIERGCFTGPVIIVGYSTGADAACWLASRLERKGIDVSTMVLIESTWGISVPQNVEYCFNIYESQPVTDWIPMFRGVSVEARGSGTELINIDVADDSDFGFLAARNHFTIANDHRLHESVGDLLVARHKLSTGGWGGASIARRNCR